MSSVGDRAALLSAQRSRLLSAYLGAGLFFMLVPGTFLGVLNLVQISGRESVALVSQAWLQAHGHAQIFGWIGSFILGIGFYSIPASRDVSRSGLAASWTSWAVWTLGVSMRWIANVYGWQWRVLLPISALLELSAFLIFFRAVSGHRPAERGRLETWTWVVISGAVGLLLTLVANAGVAIYLASSGVTPALSHGLDQRYLVLVTWGVLAPFVWGFSARWLPALLGLRPTRARVLAPALVANWAGILLTLLGQGAWATGLFVLAVILVLTSLRLFEPVTHEAKTRGVHPSFPLFVRLAYVWLLIAALLGVAAARWDVSGGIWGASRHAFTVGFVATMVFSIGQRVCRPSRVRGLSGVRC